MKNFAMKVNSETVDYLERLSFELEGMSRIIKELITDNANNPAILESETFVLYNKKYNERVAAYELGKNELINNYIPEEIMKANAVANWNLDFTSGILTFSTIGTAFDNFELSGDDHNA